MKVTRNIDTGDEKQTIRTISTKPKEHFEGRWKSGRLYPLYSVVVNNGTTFISQNAKMKEEPYVIYDADKKEFKAPDGWLIKEMSADSRVTALGGGGEGGVTPEEVEEMIKDKVDKVDGKGLSTNDYDNTEKNKVASAYQKPNNGIPKSDLAKAVQDVLDDADGAYKKPVTGIPFADLADGVQDSLSNADEAKAGLAGKQDVIQDLQTIRTGSAAGATAYQKPGGGIPASDLASGVIPTVPTISTDVSADAASDNKTSSPKSVKTYVDAGIAAVESDLSDLEDVVGAIDIGAYVMAWDGNSEPVVANIPAGVVVTYGGTNYIGTLAASASTIQKIYLVATGTTDNYDRYITVGDSTYSWVNLGTTEITLADYATKDELNQLDTEAVYKKLGTNLIDPSKFILGKGLNNSEGTTNNNDLAISDYIPVNGQSIISNAWATTYWPMHVYDADMNYLRANASTQYTYQEGDAYVRMNFLQSTSQPRANYGTTLAEYEEYNPIDGYLDKFAKKTYVDTAVAAEAAARTTAVGAVNDKVGVVAKRSMIPFIPNAPQATQDALAELYLTGLDANKDYSVKDFRSDANGKIRLYIAETATGTVVAYSEYSNSDGEIFELRTENSSGITGYAIAYIGAANRALAPTLANGVIDKTLACEIYNSQRISGYIHEQRISTNEVKRGVVNPFVPTAHDGLKDYIKELYLVGINPSETYRITECHVLQNNAVRLYIVDSNNTLVANVSDSGVNGQINGITGVAGSGVSGYVLFNAGKTIISPAPIDNGSVTNLVFSPTIKAYLSDELQQLDSANTENENYLPIYKGGINYLSGEIDSDSVWHTDFMDAEVNITSVKYDGSPAVYVARYYDGEYNYLGAGVTAGAVYKRLSIEGADKYKIQVFIGGVGKTPNKYKKNITDIPAVQGEPSFDVAKGKLDSCGSYQSELDCSPIVNDADNGYVAFNESKRAPKQDLSDLVIAVNHDDFPDSDFLATRKIYNKYGMNCNFNFILTPFSSVSAMNARKEQVRKFILDGNQVGLHAILGKSYWWMNKDFDLRPDGSSTFAPSISDLQGNETDHTGTNAFGRSITATTKASDAGYYGLPSSVEDALIVSLTSEQLEALNRCFCIYGDFNFTITGIDLDGNTVTKTTLQWLEYWYNNLIDDTLGYSSDESDAATKFAADYDDASKYPDATHIANGKMVHYQDTENPNYTDTDYQKVGKFTKGLFKGCFSCCNYEVTDRCIEVAKAFVRHYYGIEGFTNFGRHGVGYFTAYVTDNEYFHWTNSAKTRLLGEGAINYVSRLGEWMSQYDILESEGIRMTNHQHPLAIDRYGQNGLYKGQKDIQGGMFTFAEIVDYLTFFYNTGASEEMSYANFEAFVEGMDDWMKFAYEHAGQTVTRNDKTFTVYASLKNIANVIRQCAGTGKIPLLSLDTIRKNPSISTAVDLMLRFCYRMNARVVPVEVARQIANNPDSRSNFFANPMFKQSILEMFGGSSSAVSAYVPDGWRIWELANDTQFTVDDETISGVSRRALTVQTAGTTDLVMLIFGVPGGTYKLKFYAKGTGSSLRVSLMKNQSSAYGDGTIVGTLTPSASWDAAELTINIPHPRKGAITLDSPISQICRGYQENVCAVRLRMYVSNGSYSIADPTLTKV